MEGYLRNKNVLHFIFLYIIFYIKYYTLLVIINIQTFRYEISYYFPIVTYTSGVMFDVSASYALYCSNY